jgi:hypothetical protein
MLYGKSERPKVFRFREIMERCPSWLKERDWKSRVLPQVVPGVRIPLSPPRNVTTVTFHNQLIIGLWGFAPIGVLARPGENYLE